MNILFRVDASTSIGTGHIMRCLTLANQLKNRAKVIFICAELDGNMIEFLQNEGYEVKGIGTPNDRVEDVKQTIGILEEFNVDLLIIDHYQIDCIWEKAVKEEFPNLPIMVIDDLANRKHDCELLLDQNYFTNFEQRYNGLIPDNCKKLLGPKFLLLRPEFYLGGSEKSNPGIKNILVFYGGSDPTNETEKALDALEHLGLQNIDVHVVVGLSNQNRTMIEEKCKQNHYHYYVQINFLADLMRKADVALGAGGVTMWERCFLGLPSIVTIVAENQRESTKAAAQYGAVWNLGWHENVKALEIENALKKAFHHPEQLLEMSKKAQELMHASEKNEYHPVVQAIFDLLKW